MTITTHSCSVLWLLLQIFLQTVFRYRRTWRHMQTVWKYADGGNRRDSRALVAISGLSDTRHKAPVLSSSTVSLLIAPVLCPYLLWICSPVFCPRFPSVFFFFSVAFSSFGLLKPCFFPPLCSSRSFLEEGWYSSYIAVVTIFSWLTIWIAKSMYRPGLIYYY